MRQFITIAGDNSDARVCGEHSDARTVYVAEVVPDAGLRAQDDEDIECEPESHDKVRDVIVDLHVPMFCCRGPARQKPARTAEQALRESAEKGLEGLQTGETVILCGREVTL